MGAFEKAKDVTDKVEAVTEENVYKLGDVIEKGADKLDEKTGGKYSDRIDQVVDPIQNPADAAAPPEDPSGRPAS